MAKKWTKKEIKLLKKTYDSATKNGVRVLNFPKELLKLRTKPQCMWQAKKIKLQRAKRKGFGKVWDKKLTENERHYIAGLLDGEGYISTNYGNYLVGVAMTHRKTIKWLHTKLGGTFYERKKYPNRQQDYAWKINGIKEVRAFLTIFLPYLMAKKTKTTKILKEIEKKYL